MKKAYFDCSNGISGNMIIGALLNAGMPLDYLHSEIRKILPNEVFQLDYELIKDANHNAVYFDVILAPHNPNLRFEDVPRRNLHDIITLINESTLDQTIKAFAISIFNRLGEAEARAHQCPIEQIDFHEDGAIDTIIDIVGSVIGLKYLGIDEIYASPLNVGSGTIKYRYGTLVIPAPATFELIKHIHYYNSDHKGELVTPTGAAIISTLAKSFLNIKHLKDDVIAYGSPIKSSTINAWLKIIIS